MRMLLKVSMPTEEGNAAVRDGSLVTKIQSILADLKPEAAYFLEEDGLRTGIIVVQMQDTSEIPAIVEPFFLAFNARVSIRPVMAVEDLMKAGPGIEKAVKNYG